MKTQLKLANEQLTEKAVESMRLFGTFALWYKWLDSLRRDGSINIISFDAKKWECDNFARVQRLALGGDLNVQNSYEPAHHFGIAEADKIV